MNQNSFKAATIAAVVADEVSGPIRCYGIGSVDCPFNHTKVDFVYQGLR